MPQYFEDNPSVGECRAVLPEKSISLNCKNQSAINNTYDVQPEDNDKLSQQLRNEEIEIVSPETHPEYFVPVAPDGGWSWIVLLATFLNFFLIDGIFFSVGLLMFEWADHFEASKTKVSLVGSLMLGCYQMIGPFAAALTNKFGCRKVALFGYALASVSIFVSSLMPTVNALIITFGILAGSSFGLIYLPSLIAVSFYFNRRRELASGIAVAGTPFGAVIFGPLAGYLIQRVITFSSVMNILYRDTFTTLWNPCEEDVQKCTDEKKDAITEKPKSPELSTVDGQTISKQVNKSLVDSNSLIDSSSSSAHQRSSLVPNTVKLPSVSNDRIISTQEKQLLPEPVSEKRMNTSDQRQDLTADQSIMRSGYKLSSKLTNFLNSSGRSRENDPTSYVLSSPCLSVNNTAYDGQTSNEADKFLLDVYNRRIMNPLRNKKLLHHTNTTVSRRRHLSHNLTPSIPTIVEDQELTKSNGNNQLHIGQDFSSAITVANLGRDKRRISVDRNLINSGLIHSSIASALTTYHPQKIEFCKIDSKPVLVALPHESISIEDYSRPLYRSDIFFRGNPMPQIPNEYYSTINKMKSTGDVDRKMQNKLNDIYRMTNSCLTVPLNDTIDHSHVDGSYGTLSDGDEHESGFCKSQSNWIESMIVSLTSIPLPNDDNRGLLLPSTKQSLNEKLPKSFPDYDSRIHDETGGDSNICHEIYADDVDHGDADNADHVNVMDDICLCGFCLTGIRRLRDRRLCSSLFYSQKLSDCCSCFYVEQKQIYKRVNKEFPNQYEADIMDELNINDYNDLNKVTRYTRFIQCCKCVSLKPILDVLGTMLDLSLLFKPKYLILWISNLIGLLGMYVPLIYVSDFASVYGISTKLSSYFLSIMGVSSIIGRLLVAWLSSLSSVSPLILQSITQFLLGLLVCLMPVFTTFVGMATSFGFYGFLSGVFSTLSTIILYDLVGMDELTTAVGLITLSRGISSVLGAPLAGLLYEATNSFRVPYIAAGLTIIISAVLFLLILCYDWIVYLFTPVKFKRNNTETHISSVRKTMGCQEKLIGVDLESIAQWSKV
ncbi:putative monocarboxylate transporter [Schistosoma mansoni]|uniref:putative monocarboxylate transporter n=1 Tax=Schistosoma mansoni TaxID=6183 RepID=UPI0001A62E66|nr:putative monocarboxylate transporter [Schistosoma mansoni]|eukprot:XP_018648622.1 putative monocarboxylate transporter [Schistosoma mansoni]